MEPFTTHQGKVAPLNRSNVDTDAIIPAVYLKAVARTGFGRGLFANWRYLPNTEEPNPEFVLNQARYQGVSVLLAGDNFGCGSSREHAPWALEEFGFKALIAPAFADIFYNNCFSNGILPIRLPEATVSGLFQEEEKQENYSLKIDLPNQEITTPTGRVIHFEIDPFRKKVLVEGLDPIARTLLLNEDISSYEARRQPWLSTQQA